LDSFYLRGRNARRQPSTIPFASPLVALHDGAQQVPEGVRATLLGRADEVIVAARLGTQSASGGRPYSSQARFTCAIFAGGGSKRGG